MCLNRANIVQQPQHLPASARNGLPLASSDAKLLGSRLPHQPKVQGRAAIRNGVNRISCQASPYNFDPSMASLQYQPIDLPTPSVRTYDFLVLGSGIAGLTYALKVRHPVGRHYLHSMPHPSTPFQRILCGRLSFVADFC